LVREKCDHIAHIPMAGSVASLNAAMAGSIALYQAFIQRQK
jgi:23S rRNA (guanosine2251-2'-O)-methyltransferase